MSDSFQRRGFLSRLAAGTAAFSAALAIPRFAHAQAAQQRETHELDKWIDELKGQHKQIYDCVTKTHIGEMTFARNFITVNASEYGLKDEDTSTIVSMRHEATPYGYNDAMWEKYKIGESLDVPQPRAGGRGNAGRGSASGGNAGGAGSGADSTRVAGDSVAVPRATRNPQTNFITSLAGRGARFTVCALATGRYANEFALKTGATAADVRAELLANLVPNCRAVPAGVAVVNRAQERGFTYLYVG